MEVETEANVYEPFDEYVKHLARPGLGSALARLYGTMLIDF